MPLCVVDAAIASAVLGLAQPLAEAFADHQAGEVRVRARVKVGIKLASATIAAITGASSVTPRADV